jgi:Na+/H+ antiporter NhaD/arsenite permease-like protein
VLVIVVIAKEGGVFQFIAFSIARMTRGQPKKLLPMLSVTTIFITAFVSDTLAIFVLLPLTIAICKMLRLNPQPYIISQIIVVKIGAIMFLTSSVTNMVIAFDGGIDFTEFFINVGLMSFVLMFVTIGILLAFSRKNLLEKPQNVDILLETSAWNYVGNPALMYKSLIALVGMIVAFILIPSTLLSADLIALTIAIILFVASRLHPAEIFTKIDFKLIFYLLGLFVVTGALDYVGFMDLVAAGIGGISFLIPFSTFLFLFWISAYISAPVDNIAIVRVFVPITQLITQGYVLADRHLAFYGIAFGVNLGDNLIQSSGDSLIGISVAEENKAPVNMRRISLIGFLTTNAQLLTIMIIYSLFYWVEFGLILILLSIGVISAIMLWKKLRAKKK